MNIFIILNSKNPRNRKYLICKFNQCYISGQLHDEVHVSGCYYQSNVDIIFLWKILLLKGKEYHKLETGGSMEQSTPLQFNETAALMSWITQQESARSYLCLAFKEMDSNSGNNGSISICEISLWRIVKIELIFAKHWL